MSASRPKVSVMMLAYNHERYIRLAVESAFAQTTDFPFEVVVGEDCSKDGTRTILEELKRVHGDRLRLLLREKNLGAGRNYADTLEQCRGDFVALLDGDDLWTSPNKLQEQCAYMDEHPSCSLCFHEAKVIDEEGRELAPDFRMIATAPGALDVFDLLSRNPISTCTAMFRRSVLPRIPSELSFLPLQDWPTFLLLAARGTVTYLPSVWSAYRLHAAATWSPLGFPSLCPYLADFFLVIARRLGAEPHPLAPLWESVARKQEKFHLNEIILHKVMAGRWREARPVIRRYLFGGSPWNSFPPRSRLTLYLRILIGRPSGWMKSWESKTVSPLQ